MRELNNKEIKLLMKAIPLIIEIKVNNLEKAVNDCKGVEQSYREIRKFKKSIKKVYNDYKDLMEGLGYLATNKHESDKKVSLLLAKYKDSQFYFELANGNNED